MRRSTRRSLVLLVTVAGLGLTASGVFRSANAISSENPEIIRQGSRNLQQEVREYNNLMYNVLLEVGRGYYKDIDVGDIAIAGIKGMMASLDPYSDFYVEEIDPGLVADMEITTTGTYSGIGSTIGYSGGVLSIIAPMKGSPSMMAGLLAGDIIAEIDGEPSKSFSTAKAASLIKGPAGTDVTLMIEREGFPDALEFVITRAQIEVNDVSAATFAAPGIAYIEISRFSKNTGQFLVEAIEKLGREQTIEGLILDLRGNPGGLLDEAIAVTEPFLPPGEMIVYTRGRVPNMNENYLSRERQLYDGRLVVMVNQASASASEIIAGAVQDLDRGIVVGKTSFGKGLVQVVGQMGRMPDGNGANIFRLTAGEYFTASGRNLQRPFGTDDLGRIVIRNPGDQDSTDHPIFLSQRGREVTGGGGVVPDIELDGIMGNILLFDLKFRRGIFLRYVNNYVNTRNVAEGTTVSVNDELLDDFRAWAEAQGFSFETPTEMRLDDLVETASAEGADDAMAAEITALQRAIDRQKDSMWQESRESIALELRREFVTRLQGYDAGLMAYFSKDPQFQAALEVLGDRAQYAAVLSGESVGGQDK
ncbi:S41 family peptidase [Gemmatimonadota bacterium]